MVLSSIEALAARFVVATSAFVLVASSASAQDTGGLPPGFKPAQQPPKVLTLENELIASEEVAEWKKLRLQYFDAMRANQISDENRKLLADSMRIQVHQLSITDERNNLTSLRKALLRDFDRECRNEEVRAYVLGELLKQVASLLDGNFHVRCQAVMLLGELDRNPAKPGLQPVPAVSWTGGIPALLDVIDTPQGGVDQPEAVRILAARAVERLFKLGRQTLPPNSKLPDETVRRMVSELAKSGTDWYHARLTMALVQTGADMVPDQNDAPRPLIVDALARIIADPKRSYAVRAKAAFAMGRAEIPGGVQADPIAFVIVKLAQQMALDMNQGRLSSAQALFRFQDIYRGFQRGVSEPEEIGLLVSLKRPSITTAYDDIKPLFQTLMRAYQAGAPATFPPNMIQKLQNWQAPENMAIDPTGTPITQPLQASTANPGTAVAER